MKSSNQLDLIVGYDDDSLVRKLAYFVSEREAIRVKKEAGEAGPWTEDRVLQTYRFCNVKRKDDRVSKWIIENIIEVYEDHPSLWLMLCFARQINWPPTLKALMGTEAWPDYDSRFDIDLFGKIVDGIVASGEKAWTGAYMTTARGVPSGIGKGYWIAKSTLAPLVDTDIPGVFHFEAPEERTLEMVMACFKGQYGWGTFTAGQVVADMTYCNLLDKATDLKTYAPVGPGSTRGLNRLFERSLNQPIPQARFNQELQASLKHAQRYTDIDLEELTLHDWQNCMCEFDKYIRTHWGYGRPRSTYKPETAF